MMEKRILLKLKCNFGALNFGLISTSPITSDVDRPDFEVDADGGDVVPGEGVVREAHKKRALAHARVADDEELKEVVVVLAGSCPTEPGHSAARGKMGSD